MSIAAIDVTGAAALGPIWPIAKPFVSLVTKLFGPSPTDQAIDEAAKAWAAWQAKEADRNALVKAILEAEEQCKPADRRTLVDSIVEANSEIDFQVLRQVAAIVVSSEMEMRSRRQLLLAQAYLVVSLAQALNAFARNVTKRSHDVRRDLAVLGLSDMIVQQLCAVLDTLSEHTREEAFERFRSVLLDIRAALSCQIHPLIRMIFEIALGLGTDSEAAFIEKAQEIAKSLNIDTLMSLAFSALREQATGKSQREIRKRLEEFCEAVVRLS